jgi:hypothetical protein
MHYTRDVTMQHTTHPIIDLVSVALAALSIALVLSDISTIVAIGVGISTIAYNIIRMIKEIKRR